MCFYVSSVTNAMRGKAVLEQNRICSYISRSTDDTIKNGCGYCLLVTSDFEKAEALLRSVGIRIRGSKQMNDAL
ncbi:MAG TPA: hypothetical protein DEP23_11540 [Ruminococcaceae bacterium]|jgi:hypothetical protein|nr:hypothetical protein [Oscillospiraceae bacterium]